MTRAKASEANAKLEAGAGPVPRHVAIIMDGNGRWAKKRGLPLVAGHRAGAEALRNTLKAAVRHGIEIVTVYAFSSENWRRSDEEIADLTGLMRFYLERELSEIHQEGVRLRIIGNVDAFGPDLSKRLRAAAEQTRNNRRLTLVVALNYGSRAEIVAAARALADKAKAGTLEPSAIDESALAAELSTDGLPDPDLLIRTSGEIRLSNFLLWQSAYCELMFIDTLWPDFDDEVFAEALSRFADRERRFGGR
ncbi:MAG: polyprenyl diphosphate synthase [Sphingomicrobium sp.]